MAILNIAFIGMPSGGSWILIALAVLLLFGGKKLPELGSSMGKALTNFKKGMNDSTPSREAKDPDKIEQNDNNSNQA